MKNFKKVMFGDIMMPEKAVEARKNGVFTKSEWEIYCHLIRRHTATGELEFMATDTYFKKLGHNRRTITRTFAKWRRFGMILLTSEKRKPRQVKLLPPFFDPMSYTVTRVIREEKDRKIRDLQKELKDFRTGFANFMSALAKAGQSVISLLPVAGQLNQNIGSMIRKMEEED